MKVSCTSLIDVFITSASRPELLAKTVESFLANAKFSGEFNFILHEDYVLSHKSTRCLNVFSDIPAKILCSSPPIGLSGAFLKEKEFFTSDYLFYLQDDWELVRTIDFDRVLYFIEQWSDLFVINQLRFNKRKTMRYKGAGDDKFVKCAIHLGKYKVTTSDAWYFNPALWSMKFIRPFLHLHHNTKPLMRPFVWKLNSAIAEKLRVRKCHGKYDGEDFCNKARTYIYGGIGEPRYFSHLGSDDRMQFRSAKW